METILIVEDDITFALMLQTWLRKKGFGAETVSGIVKARKLLEEQPFDLLLCDLRLPDGDGISLLGWLRESGRPVPAIMMTGYAEIATAVQSMKEGAKDYVSKPVNPDELLKKIREALAERTAAVPSGVAAPPAPAAPKREREEGRFVEGESEAARRLDEHVRLVAPTGLSVLIQGASGTGKEHIARRIHALSRRQAGPFVALDCGAVPKELAASEFFGHVKGSFTGALADKTGVFPAADGGTLFLDEIGNLGYETQVQLLRALQERSIKPVGGSREIPVDIRLVAATNENLEQAIAKGAFREDLFHRINEFTLRMPRLCEQYEDILRYASFFLEEANRELDKRLKGFDEEAAAALLRYDWPGNLRQMKNVVRYAALLAAGSEITCRELPAEIVSGNAAPPSLSLRDGDEEAERIRRALRQAGNNKAKAARLLGIDRKTLYNKLKLYGIE